MHAAPPQRWRANHRSGRFPKNKAVTLCDIDPASQTDGSKQTGPLVGIYRTRYEIHRWIRVHPLRALDQTTALGYRWTGIRADRTEVLDHDLEPYKALRDRRCNTSPR